MSQQMDRMQCHVANEQQYNLLGIAPTSSCVNPTRPPLSRVVACH